MSSMTLPDPAATISAQGASPQPILSATQDALPVTSDALPMLTPILQSKPGTLPPVQKPSLPHPHASPKIKPPPGSGSQSLKQPALPLWQMFGSASNRPALKVGMLAGGESLDLNVLAKAAVRKRKEQECQSAEAAARDNVIAELHRRAARQAAISAVAQQHATNWLRAPMDADDADYVKHHVDLVQSLLKQENMLPDSTGPTAASGGGAVLTAVPQSPAPGVAPVGEATIIAAAKAAVAEQAAGAATAATMADPVAAASVTAAAVDRAAAVVNAAVIDASNAEATANSAAAVAALQAAAADGAAPAVAVAAAVNEAASALAAAKAKATATAEAALKAAVAQEEQRVVKKTTAQSLFPLALDLGGLVDYPSDEDSHMSRALTDSQIQAQANETETEVTSAERRALAAAQRVMSNTAVQPFAVQQPASWLPMYSMDLSTSYQQASSDVAGDLEADASGASPRAGQFGGVAGLAGAALPCSRLSGQQLGEVLDSLRELSSIHMNLSLLYSSGVLSFVDSLKHSPEASVAFMACRLSDQWRRSLACHLHTVTQPWPNCNLQQETDQLLVQCAGKWDLALPPAPEATPVPSQMYATGSKKKRKRDGWDSKKGGKGSASLLRASGSAPEAQTLHQLSQAKRSESVEARRHKRDLQNLHSDPSTLPPTHPHPPSAAGDASAAISEQAGLPISQLKDADASVDASQLHTTQTMASPDQAAAGSAAPADTVVAAAAGDSLASVSAMDAAGRPPAASTAAGGGVNDVFDLAGPDTAAEQDMAVVPSAAADGDESMPQAPELVQQDQRISKASHASSSDTVLRPDQAHGKMQSQELSHAAPASDDLTGMKQTGIAELKGEGRAGDEAADIANAADGEQQQRTQEHQPEELQAKSAAISKHKGKRKAAAAFKGNAKRQKGKQDSREASPAIEQAAALVHKGAAAAAVVPAKPSSAPSSAAASVATVPTAATAATTAKAAGSASKAAAAAAAPAKTGVAKSKKGAVAGAAAKASTANAEKASGKSSGSAKKVAAGMPGASKKRVKTAAAAQADAVDSDDDCTQASDAVDESADAEEGAEAAANEAAAAAPVTATRDRRSKTKEVRQNPVLQPSQPVKKATKQQKLPFTKAPAASPKQSKASSAATGITASGAASSGAAAPGVKLTKGKVAPDRNPAASSELASSAKLPKGKQVKASPKSVPGPGQQQTKSAKHTKQKPAGGKGAEIKVVEEDGADANRPEAEESAEDSGSDGDQQAQSTPVGRAASYLKHQQQLISDGPYAKLKPLALAASKGTLERLSKLPGWKRQSARKKHYASCDAALQASVAKHKADCADVTKKRAKKEVLRLLSELVTAVEELA